MTTCLHSLHKFTRLTTLVISTTVWAAAEHSSQSLLSYNISQTCTAYSDTSYTHNAFNGCSVLSVTTYSNNVSNQTGQI